MRVIILIPSNSVIRRPGSSGRSQGSGVENFAANTSAYQRIWFIFYPTRCNRRLISLEYIKTPLEFWKIRKSILKFIFIMWWGFAIENFDTQRVFNFISILKGIFFPVTVFAIYNIESPFQPKNTTKAVVEANLTKVDKELEDQIKDIDKLDLTPETMRRNGALIFSVYFNVICAFEAGCAPVISETKGTVSRLKILDPFIGFSLDFKVEFSSISWVS